MHGKPVVVIDYETFGKHLEEDQLQETLKAIVMRDQETGMIAGHMCERKGNRTLGLWKSWWMILHYGVART